MILQNIDDWMAPYLQVANINTFQQLVQCVNRLQRKPPAGSQPSSSNRFHKGGRGDAKTIAIAGNNKKGKGKGKSKAQNLTEVATTSAARDASKPTYGATATATLEERRSKPYSFRRDRVAKIFRDALKDNLSLPEPKRPGEVDKADQPNFCPYHRMLGHTIEDCFVFKDLIEKKYKNGDIQLPQSVLQEPAPHTYAQQANLIYHARVCMYPRPAPPR